MKENNETTFEMFSNLQYFLTAGIANLQLRN